MLMNRLFLATLVLRAIAFGQTPVATITLGPPPNTDGPSATAINPNTNKGYLFAGNMVSVLDLSTAHAQTNYIALPAAPLFTTAPPATFVNPATNKIYAFRGNQFVVIDGGTDTVIQTFLLPPNSNSAYTPVAFNPVTKKIYVGELSAAGTGETRVLDPDTFATLAVIPSPLALVPSPVQTSGFIQVSENPETFVFSGATNRVFILYQQAGGQIVDATTNAVVAQADCSTVCNALAFYPGVNGAVLNPIDNSIWAAISGSAAGPAGGEDGANGFPGAPQTLFYRVDLTSNAVTKPVLIYGQETEMLGFDAATGYLYMMATNLPTVPNPTSLSPTISAIETMLVVLDPNNVTPTATDPSPMRRITVDGSLLAPTGTAYSCGKGVQAFEPVALDLSGGSIYWRCDSTFNSFSSIVVSKTSFTDLGNVDYSQFLGQLPTTAAGQISGHAIPVGITKDYAFGANIAPNHAAVLWSQYDNLAFQITPGTLQLTTIPLGAQPAGLVVDPAAHRAYVTDAMAKVLTIIDTNTFTVASKGPAPGGSLIGANGAHQYVLAGPSAAAADPTQVNGAFLFDGARNAVTIPLQAAATSAISVNPVTNAGFFADGPQWYAVDLTTGNRLYSVSQLTAAGNDTCQMNGVTANRATNRIFVAGHCTVGGNTLAVFDGAVGALVASINVDAIIVNAGRLAVNPNTNTVYLEATVLTPNGFTATGPSVEVFDGATLSHKTSIANRKGPFAVNTVTNMVYAAITNAGAAAIDGLAPEQSSTFGSSQVVSALAVDEVSNNVYLASDSAYVGFCCTPSMPVFQAAAATISVFHQDPATYLVSGVVADGAGVPVAGITVTVAGQGVSVSQVTGPNGLFAARFVPGVYTVTPSNPAYQLSPLSQTITLGSIDQTFPTFTAIPVFHINGVVLTQAGLAVQGITISATGAGGSATAVTGADGHYSLAGLPAGTYTLTPVSPVNFYAPTSQTVSIAKADVVAPQFTVNPSLQITGFTLSPATIGNGSSATATVTINEVAPKGGIPIAITSSNTKSVNPPNTLTIPAGATSGSFTFSGSGTSTVTLTVTYSGSLAVQPSSATAVVSVVSQDTIHVTSATWSTSTHQLNVTATSTNPNAILTVTLASNGQNLGTMKSEGNGTFTLQTQFPTQPGNINVKSSLGGSTGQGVSVVP
jgi:hypothetical protein